MNFPLLRIFIKPLVSTSLILAFYFLFRGHNLPGGGFIGSLFIILAVMMIELGLRTKPQTQKILETLLQSGLALGVFCLSFGAFYPLIEGLGFFQGVWWSTSLPFIGKLSSILVFDVGVFLIVGCGLSMSFRQMMRIGAADD
jgi:multisubunit Na+/H+ antiporter MnhB subunit